MVESSNTDVPVILVLQPDGTDEWKPLNGANKSPKIKKDVHNMNNKELREHIKQQDIKINGLEEQLKMRY